MRFTRRAEQSDRAHLIATFVDAGPLFTLLSSVDHQVMYGRRGTGKTHALFYLADTRAVAGDPTVYVDMRTVGSSTGIYSDEETPFSERATRLLVDTFIAIHDQLLEFAINKPEAVNLSEVGPKLDDLADSISRVRVSGTTRITRSAGSSASSDSGVSASVNIRSTPSASVGVSASQQTNTSQSSQQVSNGREQHFVNFGDVRESLAAIASIIQRRCWVLFGEWSSVPLDLQPYLADLIRRTLLPTAGFTVKIGAIEHRCRFRIAGENDYIGIELGADVAADLNLDDFMVFDNDPDRASAFFEDFVFKHYKASAEEHDLDDIATSSSSLVQRGFTQRNAFDEFVRAVEGVPRDALNILSLCAQRALDTTISIPVVRQASRSWYQRDKEAAVADTQGIDLLRWIIDEVIGERRARAFLLQSNTRHSLVDALFDSRLLHILKRDISARDQPGVRYNAYKLDFGCYVDLITTAREPQGLLPGDGEGFVEVPPDDYRAIRRAILDLEGFFEQTGEA